jgi:cytoskeletal protein RodZ
MHNVQNMSQKPGRELKRLRETKGITLEQAAKDTCLRAGFLEEIENCAAPEDLPGVYHKLSLKMYSRYLGLEVAPDSCAPDPNEKVRIASADTFIRRMGRPPKSAKTESTAQRSSIFGLVKATGAAVVVILAFGLWSLNAKLSRLNIDDLPDRAGRAATTENTSASQPEQPESPAPVAQEILAPTEKIVELDRCILLTLTPDAPSDLLPGGSEPEAEALAAEAKPAEEGPAAE